MFHVYFYGALRVLVSDEGKIVAVQSRITGMAAEFTFSPAYIRNAEAFALNAFNSQYSEA